MLLFLFCLVGALSVKSAWFKLLLIVSTIFALYAVLTSGTRGGWIAFPTLIFLFISYDLWNVALWKRLLGSILLVVVLVGAYHSPDSITKQRVDQAIEQLSDYYTDNKMSSVGYRLEMWKASYLSANDHVFLGAGENSYRSEVQRLAKDGRVHEGLQKFVDPHSQYFNSLLDQGIMGLVSLLLIFIIPLKVLLNNLKDHNQSHISTMFSFSILLVFMEFMLTISALEIQIMTLFFAFSLSIFLGLFAYNRNYI
jgi:O-antigen ligase